MSISKQHYYPTESDLSTPAKARSVLQQVLKQHYELRDAHDALQTAHAQTIAELAALKSRPPAMGPLNSQVVGLPIQPVDVKSLANGATIKWNSATGTFIIS